jgi:hypothetical protein
MGANFCSFKFKYLFYALGVGAILNGALWLKLFEYDKINLCGKKRCVAHCHYTAIFWPKATHLKLSPQSK